MSLQHVLQAELTHLVCPIYISNSAAVQEPETLQHRTEMCVCCLRWQAAGARACVWRGG